MSRRRATRSRRDPGPAGQPAAGAPGQAHATRPLRLLVAVTDPMALLLLRGQLAAAREAGFDVTVLSGPGEGASRIAASEGVPHITVPMQRSIAPGKDLVSLVRLVGAIRRVAPDIVDASTPKAGLLVTLAAWLDRVPCRVHTLHGLRFETLTGARRLTLIAMTWLTCALAHEVICISPSLRDVAVAMGVVSARKAVVLGAGSSNGIDLDRFTASEASRAEARALRRRLGIGEGDLVIGYVGRIARDKGVCELVMAWRGLRAAHPRAWLVVVGPPDATDPVPDALLAELERDPRVHLVGFADDVVPAYLAMDVLALPTYREGFGNVLVEAAALERPTVAARVTGCVDAVADGETGTLVPARDASALEQAIDRYLRDPALRAAHGQAGRARARALFERRALWQRIHARYRGLALARRQAGRVEAPAGREDLG